MQSLLGLLAFPLIAVAFSRHREAISPRYVAGTLALQIALAITMLFIPPLRAILTWLSGAVLALQQAADVGAQFMFGFLAGSPPPFEVVSPAANFVVAFRVLPLILVVSVLSAILFHWRILPAIISAFSWLLQRALAIDGVLAFVAASSVFLGIIESPVLIKPYLERMTRARLLAMMTCGMSTVAGTVMVLYSSIVQEAIPEALTHILVASVISVPAALMMAHLLLPDEAASAGQDVQDETSPTQFAWKSPHQNVMEAAISGLHDGVKMVVSIAAILIVLFALVHLINQALSLFPSWQTGRPISLQLLFGTLMRPLVWLAGIDWAQTPIAGELMATKTLLNEFVSYQELANLPEASLSPSNRTIMLYAMCGFANLGSLGILSGGLGAIIPDRQEEITRLALLAMVAGTLTTLMTAALISSIFQLQALFS